MGLAASPAAAPVSSPRHPSMPLHLVRLGHIASMDRASLALAQGRAAGVPRSLRAIAHDGNVPLSTLHARAQGRRSIEAKAQSQQYLMPFEEKAVIKFILEMSDLGTPIRNKFIPSIALKCYPPQTRSRQASKAAEQKLDQSFREKAPRATYETCKSTKLEAP